MATNMDRVFNSMYRVLPKRTVTFREATGWDEATGTPIYAPDRQITAKILDKPRSEDTVRGVSVVVDACFVTIWFRDWFGRDNDNVTEDELKGLVASAIGQVEEARNVKYSYFMVDGFRQEYRSHAFLSRPDGKLYAVRFMLQAA